MINVHYDARERVGSCTACGAHPLTHENPTEDVFVLEAGPGHHTVSMRFCPACFTQLAQAMNAARIAQSLMSDLAKAKRAQMEEPKAEPTPITWTAADVKHMTEAEAQQLGVQRFRDGYTFANYNVRPSGFILACNEAKRPELIKALDHGWHTANRAEPVKLADGRIMGNSEAAAELERICEA